MLDLVDPGAVIRHGRAGAARPGSMKPGYRARWAPGRGVVRVGERPRAADRRMSIPELVELIVSRMSLSARLIDALWCGDAERARAEIAQHPTAVQELHPADQELMAAAAWWYRPEAVHLMLEVGMDPHVPHFHQATPLDRAAFHGYADIVTMLLERDPNPPLTQKNEFGGIPLDACIHGSIFGWKTGFPQDHARTLTLLLEAGSPLNPATLPSGNDELDVVMRDWLRKKGKEGHGN